MRKIFTLVMLMVMSLGFAAKAVPAYTPVYKADATVKNYTIETSCEIEAVAAGIVFAAPDHSHYYMWQVNLVQGDSPRLRPHRWNPSGACLAEVDLPTNASVETGKAFNWKIVVSGDGTVATTYINDVQVDQREGDFAYGEFGFRASYDAGIAESAYYDYFKVTDTDNNVVLFNDDFSGTKVPFTIGTIEDGWLHIQGAVNAEYYSWPVKEDATKNYSIEAVAKIETLAAGIIFAATDHSHFYMWQVQIAGDKVLLRPHRWNPGGACLAEIELPASLGIEKDKEFTIRIDVSNDGALATTYINGTKVDERAGEFSYGEIGFRACYDSGTYHTIESAFYDYVKITDTDKNSVVANYQFGEETCPFSDASNVNGWLYIASPNNKEVRAWLTDATYTAVTDVKTDAANVNVYGATGAIYSDTAADVYSITGAYVGKVNGSVEVPAGVYVVKAGNVAKKVLVK